MRRRNRRRPSRNGREGGRGRSVRARGRDLRAAAGEVGQGREEGESSGFGSTGGRAGGILMRGERGRKRSVFFFFLFGGRPLLRFPPSPPLPRLRLRREDRDDADETPACAARGLLLLLFGAPRLNLSARRAPPEEDEDAEEEEASRHDFLFAFFFPLSFPFFFFDSIDPIHWLWSDG